MSKSKFKEVTTPVGVAQWPYLNEPDTKFNANGEYRCNLRLPREDAEGLITEIKSALDRHLVELKKDQPNKKFRMANLPFSDVEVDGDPTGEVEFKFKMKAVAGSGDRTFEQRPIMFDSQLKPTQAKVGGGTRLKVGAEIVPYNVASIGVGVSLRMKSVQIIELVEFSGGASADRWDFNKEDGFVEVSENASESETSTDDHDW